MGAKENYLGETWEQNLASMLPALMLNFAFEALRNKFKKIIHSFILKHNLPHGQGSPPL
jgi:hypothetical protein